MNYSLQPSALTPGTQNGKHWARRMVQLSDVTHQETGVTLTNEQMDNIALALAQGQEVLIPGLGYIIPTIAGGTDMDNPVAPTTDEVGLGFRPHKALLKMVRDLTSFTRVPTVVKTPIITSTATVNAVNSQTGTIAITANAALYIASNQYLTIKGSSLPVFEPGIIGDYALSLTATDRLAAQNVIPLMDYILESSASRLKLLIPDNVLSGSLYLPNASNANYLSFTSYPSGLPLSAYPVALKRLPLFGNTVDLVSHVGATGQGLLRAIKDDVGDGIKMAYEESGASAFGTSVSVTNNTGSQQYTLAGNNPDNTLTISVQGKDFYTFIASTGITNGESLNPVIYVY